MVADGTPRLRTPGRQPGATPASGSKAPAKSAGRNQLPPQNPFTQENLPKYSQEELDADVVKPNMALMIYERTVTVLAFVAMGVYLGWRWNTFLNHPSTYWISIPLIVSETMLVVPGLFITYFMIWHRMERPIKRLADMNMPQASLPTVDIFIPCYNEPVEIIKATLEAASNMDYPQTKLSIIVCDDGKKEATKKMVEEFISSRRAMGNQISIRYIAREKTKGVPHHAKAGNLNNAIFNFETSGEFLVVFDCDMVCERYFINALLPHFYDRTEQGYKVNEKVALVQSPQSFVGVPSHDPLGQQYRYFYGPVMQGWDGCGSAPCCGTNVMFSRKALTSTNGFVYGSVTEDFLTSMYLHDKGYQTKYVHEYLARGLSPDSLHDFMKQRLRWAAGAVEIFYHHNALGMENLTWKQSYLYFWSGLQALLAFPLLLVCIVPFFALADSKIMVAPMDAGEYLYFMGTFMLFTVWMLFVSYRGVPKLYLMRSVQESVFMLFCKIESVVQVTLKGKMTFAVTNKDAQSPIRKDLSHVIPHLVYYLLSTLAVARVAYNATRPEFTQEELLGQGVSLIWIAVVLWQLYPPLGYVVETARKSLKAAKPAAAAAPTPSPRPEAVVTPRLPVSP